MEEGPISIDSPGKPCASGPLKGEKLWRGFFGSLLWNGGREGGEGGRGLTAAPCCGTLAMVFMMPVWSDPAGGEEEKGQPAFRSIYTNTATGPDKSIPHVYPGTVWGTLGGASPMGLHRRH